MNFLEQPALYTHHFAHHDQQQHDHMSSSMPTYAEAHAMHNYVMAQQQTAMMPNASGKTTETKARLGKDEVEVLEREFMKNPKPTTQTKRTFADSMNVELARINNWFQNRRAKRKTERKAEQAKAEEHEAALNYSGQSSPDFFHENGFHLQHAATFPIMNGPPPAIAPCNPQYANPSNASMESLDRTLVVARAGQNGLQQEIYGMMEHSDGLSFPVPQHNSLNTDRAQFPALEQPPFDVNGGYSFPSYHPASIPEIHHSPEEVCSNTPTPFTMHMPQIMTTFPSQLLPQSYESQSSQSHDDSQSPEDSPESAYGIGFNYQIQESEEASSIPPPTSTLALRSPPPPMDIASRRKKVHSKPAALIADTARGRPTAGPRTVSHAPDTFRRQADSPISSPMRRIVSAGGNRNGMSGRIQKTGIESAQRSPLNFGSFPDTTSFIERNYQNIRNPPTLTAGSSLNSSLAPPTPMSPRDRKMNLGLKREPSVSSESPVEGGLNYVYNAGGFTMEGEMVSPPETPQNSLNLNTLPSNNGWPSQESHESFYEVPDEPIYTPAFEAFPMELQMPPSYLCSLSQPPTPAFGQFQSNMMFNNGSPQFEHEQPMYTHSNHSNQQHTEYSFPESQSHFPSGMFPSPINQHKTFQFSNSTPADFSEK